MHSILIKLLTLQQQEYERAWVILSNGVILMFCFDLKHNVRDTDVDLSAFKHSVGLNRSPFTADLVHKHWQFWPKYYFQLQ